MVTYILLSTTCDEILRWMMEIWMKNHLVSDNNRNTANLIPPKKNFFLQRTVVNVGFRQPIGLVEHGFMPLTIVSLPIQVLVRILNCFPMGQTLP